jgi:hypothetical protein
MEVQERGSDTRFAGPPAGATSSDGPSTLIDAVTRRVVEAVSTEIAAVTARVNALDHRLDRIERLLEAVRSTSDPRPLLNEINVRLAELQGTLVGRIDAIAREVRVPR